MNEFFKSQEKGRNQDEKDKHSCEGQCVLVALSGLVGQVLSLTRLTRTLSSTADGITPVNLKVFTHVSTT